VSGRSVNVDRAMLGTGVVVVVVWWLN